MRSLLLANVALALVLCAGCSSQPMNNTDAGTDAGPQGGPVDGGVDTHCALDDGGMTIQPTSQASCHPPDAGTDTPDFGDTMYGSEGDDDDCKYHVKWTATGIVKNGDATFTVTIVDKGTTTPATGAAVYAEVFLNSTHPAANSGDPSVESPMGTYTIKNIVFDASGTWTVRFHIFGDCSDSLDDSPHGHAAFYVDVP